MDYVIIIFSCVLGGSILIIGGLRYHKGYNKHHFIVPSMQVRNIARMSLPLGIMLILWGLAPIPVLVFGPLVYTTWVFVIFGFGGLFIAFIAPLVPSFQSAFMKPKWLRWLEAKHTNIIPFLKQEIREMGYEEWNKQVSTQAKLEAWVNEVRRKRRL